MIWLFGVLFGLLAFWLLGFIVGDLGTWPGPDYDAVEREVIDATLLAREAQLTEELEEVNEKIDAKQERQESLRDSTSSAEKTMNQLLEIRRLALEKDKPLAPQEEESLQEARALFLDNQKKYQENNQQLVELKQQRRDLLGQQDELKESIGQQRAEAQRRYQELNNWHEIRMAGLKLAVLVPLLILVGAAYALLRQSLYLPLIYAVGIAVAVRVMFVMHEHFPARYFKYVLIGVSIVIVGWILIRLLRRVARPAPSWLLQQYREAYERFVCPVCEYPIRRGPLRYRFWTRRSIGKLRTAADADSSDSDEPYTCPSCATELYAACGACGRIRPTLMPACTHCGAELPEQELLQAGDEGS
jgi:hypothetical protein